MGKQPANVEHLKSIPWMKAAISQLGVSEVAGAGSNPAILKYRDEAGIKLGGEDSVVPWCAIFINAMLARAGIKGSGNAMARGFVASPNFEKLAAPMPGCITVISSSRGPASGHVFFYTGENGLFFEALGGNQNDSVNVSMFQRKKLVGHFWPKGQPKPKPPFDQPFKLARPLLPHERRPASDA